MANQLAGNQAGMAELRSRLLFVLFALLVYRVGTHIPVPGIDPNQLAALFNQNQGGILELFNMFSGGAWERMSILALGVIPYITASIIMNLLTTRGSFAPARPRTSAHTALGFLATRAWVQIVHSHYASPSTRTM